MIRVITLDEQQEWDDVVKTFSKYDTYWLSGYVKAFKIHGDGEPLLLLYEGKKNDSGVRGINVVMKRDIADCDCFSRQLEKDTWFDFATPYGYGGWLIEDSDNKGTVQLFRDYERWCVDNHIVSEFMRLHPIVENHKEVYGHYDIVKLGDVVSMDLTSPSIIWDNIISKNRNIIRKAVKNGIKIYNGRYPEIFETFRSIYNGTMLRDEAKEYYYFSPDFYGSILDDLPENAQIFYASHSNGKIIAAAIFLAANRKMNYHLSGSLKEFSSLGATNLILYKAAMWGSANGYETLHLGGGVGSAEDGLFKFKKSFYRADAKQFYIGRKIFEKNIYEELCKAKGTEVTNTGFFPAYRA